MRKILVLIALMYVSVAQSQTKDLLDKVPQFLVSTPKEEMSKIFQAPAFFRFSSTLPEGVVVAYENTSRAKIGSMEEILDQITKMKSKLIAAKNEKPEVEYFDWAEYRERIETYPCGLVAVFRNNELGEIWIDIK